MPTQTQIRFTNERTRDSQGRYATELQVAENRIEQLANDNERLTRMYLALSRQLTNVQRELQTYKSHTKK